MSLVRMVTMAVFVTSALISSANTQCLNSNITCLENNECCSGYCDVKYSKKCVSCLPANGDCQQNKDCCHGYCDVEIYKLCVPCRYKGRACKQNDECCYGVCDEGRCSRCGYALETCDEKSLCCDRLYCAADGRCNFKKCGNALETCDAEFLCCDGLYCAADGRCNVKKLLDNNKTHVNNKDNVRIEVQISIVGNAHHANKTPHDHQIPPKAKHSINEASPRITPMTETSTRTSTTPTTQTTPTTPAVNKSCLTTGSDCQRRDQCCNLICNGGKCSCGYKDDTCATKADCCGGFYCHADGTCYNV